MMRRVFDWAATMAIALAAAALAGAAGGAGEGVTLFAPEQPGCAIVVPVDAIAAERRAAELLRATLARAAGRAESDFPIQEENELAPRPAVYVGATRRAGDFLRPTAKPPFDTAVGLRAAGGVMLLRSERRESIESAAGWFLQKHLAAYWFMPGPLGEVVPRRSALKLAGGDETARPGFVSRDLGVSGEESREWARRNRLEGRFEHGHNFAAIFRPEDLRRVPEMAPMRAGRRFFPEASDTNWQPNLLSPAAVEHAADVATRAFTADPQRLSFSLSPNDSVRFDDSAATLAAVSPPRFFRHRPDYAGLVFGFANAVAAQVARHHPDRWLPAYAYYWGENVPAFPIARNVVPFLTADRSQWSRPEFAREDRALIERWCKSGAEIVGVYDYFYGAPFLCPRPTLFAVQESIPFQHSAGVRAFYAEMNPNWALDGPKAWLAAQLLWDPTRDPAELREIYLREFWAEAAAPMRRFLASCERTWREQPGPARWLRYYQDEDQTWIFPPERRAELRAQLAEAARSARSEAVRARVAFVTAGFGVTEAFWEFGAKRERLSRLSRPEADPAELLDAWKQYQAARGEFVRRHGEVRREHPLAIAAQDLEIYLRNQPDSRAAIALAGSEAGRALLHASADLPTVSLGVTARELETLNGSGVELLRDQEWKELATRPVDGSAAFDWTAPESLWRGTGEPWEGRKVELRRAAGAQPVLRLAGCRTEGIGQWVPATENAIYVAKARVRARARPGTATFLIVTFLDERNQHLGLGRVDRLPAADAVQATELCVLVRTPPQTRFIGFGVRVLNQFEDDFAEFSGASLRRVEP